MSAHDSSSKNDLPVAIHTPKRLKGKRCSVRKLFDVLQHSYLDLIQERNPHELRSTVHNTEHLLESLEYWRRYYPTEEHHVGNEMEPLTVEDVYDEVYQFSSGILKDLQRLGDSADELIHEKRLNLIGILQEVILKKFCEMTLSNDRAPEVAADELQTIPSHENVSNSVGL
jgi:hypothetical protein